MCSGRAEVVMSKSCGVTPRKASRTGPPTSEISSPAWSKIVPSSIIAGGSAAKVLVAFAMRVGMSVVPAFCAVTGPLFGEADWVLIAPKHARKEPWPTTGGRAPAKVESCLHVQLTAEAGCPDPRVGPLLYALAALTCRFPRKPARAASWSMCVTEFPMRH